MSDGESTGTTREASVSDEGALLAEVHRLDVARRVEHLLHARTTLRALMSNHHAIAALHLATEDALTGVFLRVEADGRTLEVPQRLIDASSLHDTAILCDITKEHGQSAILRIGMFEVADATLSTIGIEGTPLFRL